MQQRTVKCTSLTWHNMWFDESIVRIIAVRSCAQIYDMYEFLSTIWFAMRGNQLGISQVVAKSKFSWILMSGQRKSSWLAICYDVCDQQFLCVIQACVLALNQYWSSARRKCWSNQEAKERKKVARLASCHVTVSAKWGEDACVRLTTATDTVAHVSLWNFVFVRLSSDKRKTETHVVCCVVALIFRCSCGRTTFSYALTPSLSVFNACALSGPHTQCAFYFGQKTVCVPYFMRRWRRGRRTNVNNTFAVIVCDFVCLHFTATTVAGCSPFYWFCYGSSDIIFLLFFFFRFVSCFNIYFRKSTPFAPSAVVVVCAQLLFTSFLRAIIADFSLTMEKGNGAVRCLCCCYGRRCCCAFWFWALNSVVSDFLE